MHDRQVLRTPCNAGNIYIFPWRSLRSWRLNSLLYTLICRTPKSISACAGVRRRTIPGMLKAKNCRLVAVMNPSDPDRIAKEFKVPRAYRREEELLADPEVEAVYIASPVQHHARQIMLCARRANISFAKSR